MDISKIFIYLSFICDLQNDNTNLFGYFEGKGDNACKIIYT